MNIDHEHFKVTTKRVVAAELLALNLKWVANVVLKDGRAWEKYASTKAAAIRDIKLTVMPHTVRGLLCPGRYRGCNRLMGRIDNLPWLKKVESYLADPPARKVLDNAVKSEVE